VSDTTQRSIWSCVVVLVFIAAAGFLVWTWLGIDRSSASFADRQEFGTNHLGAGTVDVAFGDDTVAFAAVNMAPGDVADGRLEVVNRGTLAFRYSLSSTVADGPLLGVLDLVAWRGDGDCAELPPVGAVEWRPLVDAAGVAEVSSPTLGRLAPGTSQLLCLSASLPISAPNRFQGERLQFVVSVAAVQDVDDVGAEATRAAGEEDQ
jgi:hypothetical protein